MVELYTISGELFNKSERWPVVNYEYRLLKVKCSIAKGKIGI